MESPSIRIRYLPEEAVYTAFDLFIQDSIIPSWDDMQTS
jgi:hypothetical protein